MILSFLVVTAVLVVSLGRLGDMFGRVRTYNLGFAVFTLFSILLFVTPWRPAVRADHLAAGDLAPPTRLQLYRNAALGGHLHAAADRRLPLVAGPASGILSDRYGARPFAT